jgi:SPOR domain
MRGQIVILLLSLVVLFASSCGTVNTGSSKTGANKGNYAEDLSTYRPKPVVVETQTADTLAAESQVDSAYVDLTEKLNTVLDTAAIYARSTITYIDGFTIQVYGGDDRSLAKDYRFKLIRNFPQTNPRTVFEQPNYKVRVGQYYTRLEAQHLYTEVKQVFRRAIIIPARIYIK